MNTAQFRARTHQPGSFTKQNIKKEIEKKIERNQNQRKPTHI